MKKLIITFLVLNLLDCITTFIGLKLGLTEANLFLNFLFEINIFLGLVIKMILAIGIVFGLHLFKKIELLKIVNIVFTIIIFWNVVVILWG